MATTHFMHITGETATMTLRPCLNEHTLEIKDDDRNDVTVFLSKEQLDELAKRIEVYLDSMESKECAE